MDNYGARVPRGFRLAGAWWPGGIISEPGLRALKHYPIFKDDVVIISYPKSGTTWVSEIVSAIMNDGDFQKLSRLGIHVRVPWLEVEAGHWKTGILAWMFLTARWFCRLVGWRGTPTGDEPRTFFTHVPLELVPQKILDGHCKVIYVARNPKDVAVSLYCYHKIARYLGQQKKLSWDDFYRNYVDGNVYNGSWFDHVKSYWNMSECHPENWIFVTYEQLKRDPRTAVKTLAAFLNRTLNEDTLTSIVHHTSFGQMKSNKFVQRAGLGFVNENKDVAFFRKGDVGDWRNYFTESQNIHFENVYSKQMQGFDKLKNLIS